MKWGVTGQQAPIISQICGIAMQHQQHPGWFIYYIMNKYGYVKPLVGFCMVSLYWLMTYSSCQCNTISHFIADAFIDFTQLVSLINLFGNSLINNNFEIQIQSTVCTHCRRNQDIPKLSFLW